MKMNRRDFVTKLLSVPVGVAAIAAMPAVKPRSGMVVERIPPEEYYVDSRARDVSEYIHDAASYYEATQWSRAQQTELLAKWYNSKVDTLVLRGYTHG